MTDNMKLWDAVSKTNPENTKQVNQRGGFTAVNANSQIMEATRQFGPIGIGWGYDATPPIFHDNLVFVQVTLWHGERSNTVGPMLCSEEWKNNKGRLDSDAGKKATTDGITKLLSQLGFNADVFLGKFDDQKYVDDLREEMAPKIEYIDDAQLTELQGMIDGYGFNVKNICAAYKIDALTKIPADKFNGVKKALNDKHDKQKKEKQNA